MIDYKTLQERAESMNDFFIARMEEFEDARDCITKKYKLPIIDMKIVSLEAKDLIGENND